MDLYVNLCTFYDTNVKKIWHIFSVECYKDLCREMLRNNLSSLETVLTLATFFFVKACKK